MTMAGSRIEEVPADQFNHCVVARKADDDWIMYDPTWVPYNNDIWSKLETEQHYLDRLARRGDAGTDPVQPAGGVPAACAARGPPGWPTERWRERCASRGGARWTAGCAGSSPRTPRRTLEATVRGHAGAALSRGGGGAGPPSRRPTISRATCGSRSSYRAPGFALPVGEGLEFTQPGDGRAAPRRHAVPGRGARRGPTSGSRTCSLYYTQLVDVEERIRLPRGYAATNTARSPRKWTAPTPTSRVAAEAEEGVLTIRSPRRGPPPPDPARGLRGVRRRDAGGA